MSAMRLSRFLLTLFGMALSLCVVGCASWSLPWPPKQTEPVEQRNPVTPPASAPPTTLVNAASLEGSAWSVLYVQDVGSVVDPKPYLHWAQFPRVEGSGGCNRFSGQAHIEDKEQLRFTALASTRMACMPEPGGQEDKFFKALELTRQARLEGDDLILLDLKGQVLAQLRRMDPHTISSP